MILRVALLSVCLTRAAWGQDAFVTGGSDSKVGPYQVQDAVGGMFGHDPTAAEISGWPAVINNPPVVGNPNVSFTGRPDLPQSISHTRLAQELAVTDIDGDPIVFSIAALSGTVNAENWMPPASVVGVSELLRVGASDGVNVSGPPVTITAAFSPLILNNNAPDIAIPYQATSNLVAMVNGTLPFNWQWQKDGQSIAGAVSSQLSIGPAQRTDTGNYRFTVSNPHGQATSSNRFVRVLLPQLLRPPVRLPDGGMRINFDAFDGMFGDQSPADFLIQWSHDLVQWQTMTNSVQLAPDGSVQFIDRSGDSRRFYRVISR